MFPLGFGGTPPFLPRPLERNQSTRWRPEPTRISNQPLACEVCVVVYNSQCFADITELLLSGI
jgi:hypothetical protein